MCILVKNYFVLFVNKLCKRYELSLREAGQDLLILDFHGREEPLPTGGGPVVLWVGGGLERLGSGKTLKIYK